MSIKTTHNVTRDFARSVIVKKLYDLNDDQLSNILEEVIHNGFYNFRIKEEDEIDKINDFYFDDLENLPEYNNAW